MEKDKREFIGKKHTLQSFLDETSNKNTIKKIKKKFFEDESDSDLDSISNSKEKVKEKEKKEEKEEKKIHKNKNNFSVDQSYERNIESKKQKTQSNPENEKINKFTGLPYSKRYYDLLEKRKTLPAYESKDNILNLLKEHQILIIQGETGSGKTTQIPQFLLEAGYKKIAVTQPRRVAAMSVAKRVSEELDVKLGEEVGYSVRFEEKSSKKTMIKYLTDGMLLREAMSDNSFKRYNVIFIDEAHERTLATDILFGYIKTILAQRKEIKLIIMSATLDIRKFQDYFNAPVILIPGRLFEVDIRYLKAPADDYFESSISRVLEIHKSNKKGDILLFLTGEEEIEEACMRIREEISEYGDEVGLADVIPLYSSLPPNQQQKIFNDPPKPNKNGIPGRKIIVATNIAETSITIDGIVYVIDPGFSKQKIYNPRSKIESLLVSQISQESADQRAGRAGRTQKGICYRLYTEESYKKDLRKNTFPEILRSNVTSVVLILMKLNIDDLVHFDFIDPPAPETMMRALELLNHLGAIDDDGQLTDLGRKMSELPLIPELAKALISGVKYKCINEMLTITAMLSVKIPFLRPRGAEFTADTKKNYFNHITGDHLALLNVYNEYQKNKNKNAKEWCNEYFINSRSMAGAEQIRKQLEEMIKKMFPEKKFEDYDCKEELTSKKEKNIIKCLISGYFSQIAYLTTSNYYITVRDNQYCFIHPSSSLCDIKPKWVLYNEIVLTDKNFLRTITIVNPKTLLKVHPIYFDPDTLDGHPYKKEFMEIKKQMDDGID